jgi:hypothetical protein
MRVAITHKWPAALILSRQDLSILDRSGATGDASKGGYILADSDGAPDVVLIATGSEVELAMMARETLAERAWPPAWCRCRAGSCSRSRVPNARRRYLATAPLHGCQWKRVSPPAGSATQETRAPRLASTATARPARARNPQGIWLTKEHVAATALRVLGRGDEADELDAEYLAGQETAGTQPSGSDGHS